MNLARLCCTETEQLHAFLQDWLTGDLPRTPEAFARFADVMSEDLIVISPRGTETRSADLLVEFEALHGVLSDRREHFRIWVENCRCHQIIGDKALVTYEEWHADGDDVSARVSTVLYGPKEGTPNGLQWLHVHETWLPDREPAAGERFPEKG